MATSDDILQIEQIVSGLLGKKAWSVWLGVGSFVLFEFGKPITKTYTVKGVTKSYTHGEWHLWIYCCHWWLGRGTEVIATSDDSRDMLAHIIKKMENVTLEAIELTSPLLEATLSFENDLQFHILAGDYAEDAEDWILFTPNNDHVLVVGPDGKWSYQSANEPRP